MKFDFFGKHFGSLFSQIGTSIYYSYDNFIKFSDKYTPNLNLINYPCKLTLIYLISAIQRLNLSLTFQRKTHKLSFQNLSPTTSVK